MKLSVGYHDTRSRLPRPGFMRRSGGILHHNYNPSHKYGTSASPKMGNPSGLSSGRRLAALLLSYRSVVVCSFVAPCQAHARA